MRALAGRIVALADVAKYPILLPDRDSVAPDTAVVVSSGVSCYSPGDTIVCVPGTGAVSGTHEGRDIRLFGVNFPWWTQIIGSIADGDFIPGPGYAVVERERPSSTIETLEEWCPYGKCIASCEEWYAETLVGERVALPMERRYQDLPEYMVFQGFGEKSWAVFWAETASRGWLRSIETDGLQSNDQRSVHEGRIRR